MGLLRRTSEARARRGKREKPEPDWRDILWRQWLHSSDRRVARRIFEHLADDRPRWEAYAMLAASLAVMGALPGIAAAPLVSLDAGSPSAVYPSGWVACVSGAGACLGLVTALFVGIRARSWRQLLPAMRRLLSGLWSPLGFGVAGAVVLLALLDRIVPEVYAVLLALAGMAWLAVFAAYALADGVMHAVPVADARVAHPPPLAVPWWWAAPTETELARVVADPHTPSWVREALSPSAEAFDLNELVADVVSGPPARRETALEMLARLDTRAIRPMLMATTHPAIIGLAKSIGRRSQLRRPLYVNDAVCPDCLCRFRVMHYGKRIGGVSFCACRSCHQSKRRIEQPGPIIAILDTDGDDKLRRKSGALLVNWTARARNEGFEASGAFDFDRVEILRATDEEVRHFLVDVQNDTDEKRRKGYRKMTCTVAPDCALGEGTLRQLRATFGEVMCT